MMTNASADPVAMATSIARAARSRAALDDRPAGAAAVVALAGAVILSLAALAAMALSPAAVPMWCAAHGGCP
jgi:hypothetical protein